MSVSAMKSLLRRFAVSLAFTLACGHALGQAYPAKPIRLIVPFPAGGAVASATDPPALALHHIL